MSRALSIAALAGALAGAPAAACPPGEGQWVTAAGAEECRPCTSLAAYGETTRLPAGCVALMPGILWTPAADARIAGEVVELRTRRDSLVAELAALHADAQADRIRCEAELRNAADGLDGCADATVAVAAVASPSPWPYAVVGAVVGASLGVAATWYWVAH